MTTTNALRRRGEAGASDDPLLDEVLEGLAAAPRTLPCTLFYDDEGSRLYERITELEVYYPFRAESEILATHGDAIAAAVGPGALVVEYGSGSSAKTRLLLDRLEAPAGYVPIDISREHLLDSAGELARRYPALVVTPVCADFTGAVALPDDADREAPRLGFFPGSTIGNFDHDEAVRLLARIRALVRVGGRLLIGVDLPKDRETLERAYDDPQGVTAAFNRNILAHVNRRFGADFVPERFAHEARWNEEAGRVEMHLRCLEDHAATVHGHRFEFTRGETIWTESSYKHDPERFRRMAAEAGFACEAVWLDAAGRYSLHLLGAI